MSNARNLWFHQFIGWLDQKVADENPLLSSRRFRTQGTCDLFAVVAESEREDSIFIALRLGMHGTCDLPIVLVVGTISGKRLIRGLHCTWLARYVGTQMVTSFCIQPVSEILYAWSLWWSEYIWLMDRRIAYRPGLIVFSREVRVRNFCSPCIIGPSDDRLYGGFSYSV